MQNKLEKHSPGSRWVAACRGHQSRHPDLHGSDRSLWEPLLCKLFSPNVEVDDEVASCRWPFGERLVSRFAPHCKEGLAVLIIGDLVGCLSRGPVQPYILEPRRTLPRFGLLLGDELQAGGVFVDHGIRQATGQPQGKWTQEAVDNWHPFRDRLFVMKGFVACHQIIPLLLRASCLQASIVRWKALAPGRDPTYIDVDLRALPPTLRQGLHEDPSLKGPRHGPNAFWKLLNRSNQKGRTEARAKVHRRACQLKRGINIQTHKCGILIIFIWGSSIYIYIY